MSKIKFGAIITDSRGHVGGTAFKWSRNGNIMLRTATPSHRQTIYASRSRSLFAGLSKKWWTVLTPTQRTAWRALAAAHPRPNVWGDEFPLSGLALFVGINATLTNAGLATTNDAPSDQFVQPVATATLSISAPSTVSLAFTPTPAPTDHRLYLTMTRARSPGVLNFDHTFLFLGASGAAQTSPWNIASLFTARLGTVAASRQYAAQLAFLNTTNGALSPRVLTTAIAT